MNEEQKNSDDLKLSDSNGVDCTNGVHNNKKVQSNRYIEIIIYFVALIFFISIFVVSIKLFGDKTISFSGDDKSETTSVGNDSNENRKMIFVDVAKSYVNATRNAMLAAELKCTKDEINWVDVENAPYGSKNIYYFMLDTGSISNNDAVKRNAQVSTYELLESGGKSPFNATDIIGYVTWIRTKNDGSLKTSYQIKIVDENKNGFKDPVSENNLKEDLVLLGKANYEDKPKEKKGYTYYRCIFK